MRDKYTDTLLIIAPLAIGSIVAVPLLVAGIIADEVRSRRARR